MGENCSISFSVKSGVLLKIGIESQLNEANSLTINSRQHSATQRILQLYQKSEMEIIGHLKLHFIAYET